MKNEQNVNLARKLRPRSFSEIVGQGLSVKILQNSLYVKKYFPVYLFAGQRGCGKTTTARVFAAAVNCCNLHLFQQDPAQQALPCLTCTSCLAMADGSHPDFIEIDAASHTGVDHVRQIIESAAYVPLLGQKKVYLIDEAHMLSKAAFNAFLKILEEPPATVLFMLATTERHKIPETVLSRCFQLSFPAIEQASLRSYLIEVCKQEEITIDDDALDLIIEETDGSARDALNVLEQVRFSSEKVSQEAIVGLLGKVSNQVVITLLRSVLEHDPAALLTSYKQIVEAGCSAQVLWELLAELLRAMLWAKNGITQLPKMFMRHQQDVQELAGLASVRKLYQMLSFIWSRELLFLQTAHKHVFLEMLLLQLCNNEISVMGGDDSSGRVIEKKGATVENKPAAQAIPQTVKPVKEASTSDLSTQREDHSNATSTATTPWEQVVHKIAQEKGDAFLDAILKQARVQAYDKETGVMKLQLSNSGPFFKDKVQESVPSCHTILQAFFPGFASIEFIEGAQDTKKKTAPPAVSALEEKSVDRPKQSSAVGVKKEERDAKSSSSATVRTLKVDDKEQWPGAHTVLSHVPGVIKIEE